MKKTLSIRQLAPILAAARDSKTHDEEPTWTYVLNYWDSRDDEDRERLLPDVSPIEVTETLQFLAEGNPDGTVPEHWAAVPAVELNPLPAAPERLRLRRRGLNGDEILELSASEVLELIGALADSLSMLAIPALKVGDGGWATCPHCAHVTELEYESVKAIDIDIRRNAAALAPSEAFAPTDPSSLILDVVADDTNYQTATYVCTHCGTPVSLPDAVEEVWN